ncbi:unnamed protein product [Dovyalis caffra]|uniref:BAG domain-containing protein n=1 Tax=Dovyalis caffra TaxID=77055 RepID=A0AAV1RL95_9ROSI|nr:unnamed protein product [Dovyalis caffra]
MDAPFYRIHRNHPSRSPYYYNSPSSSHQFPVQHRTTELNVPKKVVSIPVRHVGSERSRSEFAIKIQKVFRGFLVRKSMKKILAIKREVSEIEERVLMKESVELMRRDQKEKMKINEMLMSLLFKLDSVRGVDSGVRDCRKAVIKKAIALQETVDSITAAANDDDAGSVNGAEEINDSVVPAGEQGVDETAVVGEEDKRCEANSSLENAVDELQNRVVVSEAVSMPVDSRKAEEEVNETIELRGEMGIADTVCEGEKNMELAEVGADEDSEKEEVGDAAPPVLMGDCDVERVLEVVNENLKLQEGENDDMACEGEDGELEEQVDKEGDMVVSMIDCIESFGTESQSDSSANPQSLIEGDEEDSGGNGQDALGKNDGDGVEIHQPDEKKGDTGVKSNDGRKEEKRRSKELLERMVEDNERMMGLMAELFERNEVQTRLLSSLTQRVERLERAYVCEKLRRKKKRNAAGLVDCLETTQDSKKCGKKF